MTYVMKTEDGVTVKTGALIYYVNYFNNIVPTIFKQKGKSSVTYFALYKNALQFKNEQVLKNH